MRRGGAGAPISPLRMVRMQRRWWPVPTQEAAHTTATLSLWRREKVAPATTSTLLVGLPHTLPISFTLPYGFVHKAKGSSDVLLARLFIPRAKTFDAVLFKCCVGAWTWLLTTNLREACGARLLVWLFIQWFRGEVVIVYSVIWGRDKELRFWFVPIAYIRGDGWVNCSLIASISSWKSWKLAFIYYHIINMMLLNCPE